MCGACLPFRTLEHSKESCENVSAGQDVNVVPQTVKKEKRVRNSSTTGKTQEVGK